MASTPEDARRALSELGRTSARTAAVTRASTTGVALAAWGFAWIIAYPALSLLHGRTRLLVVVLAWLVAMGLSWRPERAVRSAHSRRARWAWAAIFASVPFLAIAADPTTWADVALLTGGVWSLAMSISAIAASDAVYAVVAFTGVISAAVASAQELMDPLLLFGIAAGAPLFVLGATRVIAGRRHG